MARRVRIVVGEGRTAQRGLLRFVLEGEGFDVVGEARGTADLTGVIDEHGPDVVVLDDGISVTAVSTIHELAPQTKIVLVWPSAVVPIGGDARVEPAKILRDLGPAVHQVMAPAAAAAAVAATFERPDWIEKVRKDPAALRDKLASGSKRPDKRPSVTRLQRHRRLHPTGSAAAGAAALANVPEPVVALPVDVGGADAEPVLDIGGEASGADLAGDPIDERSEWNRRLGTLALSGAAAVSAVVLALALGGGRVSPNLVRGGGQFPVGVPGIVRGGDAGQGPFGSGTLGGRGYEPGVVGEPAGPDENGTDGNDGPDAVIDDGLGGDLSTPDPGIPDQPPPDPGPGDDGGNGDGDGGNGDGDGGNGGNGDGDGGGNGGDDDGGHGGNGGNGGNGGGGGDHDDDDDDDGNDSRGHGGGGGHNDDDCDDDDDDGTYGKSAEHNPHGGAPGHLCMTPAHGGGLGVGSGPQHTHKH